MKLVTFLKDNSRRVGVLDGEGGIVDLTAIGLVADMNDLIERFAPLRGDIQKAVAGVKNRIGASEVRLLAPIPTPRRNIFCVGKNYHEHAQEFANSGYDSSSSRGAVPSRLRCSRCGIFTTPFCCQTSGRVISRVASGSAERSMARMVSNSATV